MQEINTNMEEEMKKAAVLTEALPFIREFWGKKVVVKYGGSAMVDEELKVSVIRDVALLKLIGLKPVIVHGGGKEISKWVKLKGKEPKFVNGLRVTDDETMEIAEMVLSKVNKGLVAMMEGHGVKAVGISGKDGNLMKAMKKMPDGQDIGFVGEVTEVDSNLIDVLLDNDYVPVIAPIGIGENQQSFNINADDAACAIARCIGAEKLVFLTDIEGVFMDPTDKKTLISEMDLQTARSYIENGVVGGGMLPKLNNCIEAIENGVSRVHILDGRLQHCLLLELFTTKGIGTAILKEPLFTSK